MSASLRVFRLHRPGGIELTLTDRGATWLDCRVPMGGGAMRSVVLQRAAVDDASADRAFLGATVGRYANRIAQARIAHAGRAWALAPHPAGSAHQLHGGPDGFHLRQWQVVDVDEASATFALHSPDGDQGYPGAVDVRVTYRLVDALTIEMAMQASTTAPTPLALTNHAYFQLDGQSGDVRRHRLRVAASHYMPVDGELIPIGAPQPVAGTSFDFRDGKRLEADWLADAQQALAGGYDHAFLLDAAATHPAAPAAELVSSAGDLALRISTTLPALQVYAGQYVGGTLRPDGGTHAACAGVCLEPGFLPDSPNHPEWPQASCWLMPGAEYRHVIRYAFEPRGDAALGGHDQERRMHPA